MISVQDMLKNFENVRLAGQQDNDEILAFIKTIQMKAGPVSLRYERSPNYFEQTRLQGDSGFVLVVTEDNKIAGVTSITVKNVYCNGSVVKAACFSDLRIKPGLPAKIRNQWRSVYFSLVNHFRNLKELHECDFMYAVVLSENKSILRTFHDQNLPILHDKVDDLLSYNILGKIPLPLNLIKSKSAEKLKLTVRQARHSDLQALKNHLQRENQGRVMGHYFATHEGDEFSKRMQKWHNFDLTKFIIAENQEHGIVGCIYPWSSSISKRLVAASLPFGVRMIGHILPLFGKPRLMVGRELKVLYLTHLEIDSSYADHERQLIFAHLLRELYKSQMNHGYHVVSFSDFPTRPLAPGLRRRGFVTSIVPTSIYQLIPKLSQEKPIRIHKKVGNHVGYELAVL